MSGNRPTSFYIPPPKPPKRNLHLDTSSDLANSAFPTSGSQPSAFSQTYTLGGVNGPYEQLLQQSVDLLPVMVNELAQCEMNPCTFTKSNSYTNLALDALGLINKHQMVRKNNRSTGNTSLTDSQQLELARMNQENARNLSVMVYQEIERIRLDKQLQLNDEVEDRLHFTQLQQQKERLRYQLEAHHTDVISQLNELNEDVIYASNDINGLTPSGLSKASQRDALRRKYIITIQNPENPFETLNPPQFHQPNKQLDDKLLHMERIQREMVIPYDSQYTAGIYQQQHDSSSSSSSSSSPTTTNTPLETPEQFIDRLEQLHHPVNPLYNPNAGKRGDDNDDKYSFRADSTPTLPGDTFSEYVHSRPGLNYLRRHGYDHSSDQPVNEFMLEVYEDQVAEMEQKKRMKMGSDPSHLTPHSYLLDGATTNPTHYPPKVIPAPISSLPDYGHGSERRTNYVKFKQDNDVRAFEDDLIMQDRIENEKERLRLLEANKKKAIQQRSEKANIVHANEELLQQKQQKQQQQQLDLQQQQQFLAHQQSLEQQVRYETAQLSQLQKQFEQINAGVFGTGEDSIEAMIARNQQDIARLQALQAQSLITIPPTPAPTLAITQPDEPKQSVNVDMSSLVVSVDGHSPNPNIDNNDANNYNNINDKKVVHLQNHKNSVNPHNSVVNPTRQLYKSQTITTASSTPSLSTYSDNTDSFSHYDYVYDPQRDMDIYPTSKNPYNNLDNLDHRTTQRRNSTTSASPSTKSFNSYSTSQQSYQNNNTKNSVYSKNNPSDDDDDDDYYDDDDDDYAEVMSADELMTYNMMQDNFDNSSVGSAISSSLYRSTRR